MNPVIIDSPKPARYGTALTLFRGIPREQFRACVDGLCVGHRDANLLRQLEHCAYHGFEFQGTASFEVNGTSCGYTFTATQN